jgi:hypothetical protein
VTSTDVRRCAVNRCTGPDGRPRLLSGDQLACDSCIHQGHGDIAGLPRRYVMLRLALQYRGGQPEKITGPGFGSRSPLRDAALVAMESVVAFCIDTDNRLRSEMEFRQRPYSLMRPAQALSASTASTLALWWRGVCYPAGVAAIDGSARMRWHVDQVLGWTRLRHRLPAPCPYCDLMTLVRDDGSDFVRCSGCHRSWNEREYALFVRMLADEMGATG